ncbi:MAG: flagellin [Gemmatimonadetes bacterium]|nr:flagellin [Gemmatimonadota bacterium]
MNLTSGTLGLDASVNGLVLAQAALLKIDTALNTVNGVLGNIGAGQNRLSNAIDNLKSTILNYQSAESTIRDLDMAGEMVTFSKNQILAQAGTAMLAQANQSGQGILKLLQ